MDAPHDAPLTIESNLLKCFAPTHLLQLFIGTLRVDIRNQSVTYNSTGQLLYRLGLIFVNAYALYEITCALYEKFSDYALALLLLLGMSLLFSSCVLCNLVNISFFNQTDNLAVYLYLKNVDSFLKFCGFIDNIQYYLNFFLNVVAFVISYLSSQFFFYYLIGYIPATVICGLFTCGILYIYFEMVSLAGLLYYLTKRLEVLKGMFLIKVERLINQDYRPLESGIVHEEQLLPVVTQRGSNHELDQYVLCLNNILNTFSTLGKIYKFQIFLYLATLFMLSFLTIATTVEGTQIQVVSWNSLAMIYIYIGIYHSVLIVFVLICNYYAMQIKELKVICMYVLARCSTLHEDPELSAAKRMLSLMDNESHVISVYGILDVDISLPVKFILVIANYAIILMQITMF